MRGLFGIRFLKACSEILKGLDENTPNTKTGEPKNPDHIENSNVDSEIRKAKTRINKNEQKDEIV